MKLLILTRRFLQTPDGHLWNRGENLAYGFWTRYLDHFESVDLLVRATPTASAPEGWHRATGDRVHAAPVPDFDDPLQLLIRLPRILAAIRAHFREAEAILFRATSDPFASLAGLLLPKGRVFGVELVGNPYNAFTPGASNSPLRGFYRWFLTRETRRLCQRAAVTSYVTASALQQRFPANPNGFSTHYSSIDLPESSMAPRSHRYNEPLKSATLTVVGTLQRLFKGQDLLIDSVAALKKEGFDLTLNIVGSGRERGTLEKQATRLGVASQVRFHGQVSQAEVIDLLDRSDLFLLPSRHEGLPRAVIEAMARGLPAIGTALDGIVELLPEDALVRPGDGPALTKAIRTALESPETLTRWAEANRTKARLYLRDELTRRRGVFFTHLIDVTRTSHA